MKKYLSILLFTAAVTGLTSCLKDDNANLTPDNSPAVVEFSSATLELPSSSTGTVYALYDRAYEIATSVDVPFQINYTGGSAAPKDIKVTIGTKPSAITEYVAEQAEDGVTLNYTELPSDFYQLPTNVVIPAGQRKVTINVKLNTSLMTDFTKNYVLPISITDADGTTISGNFGTILAKIAVKNAYDGQYEIAGTITRNSASGPDASLGGTYKAGIITQVRTIGQFQNAFTTYWRDGSGVAGIDGLNLTVDPATNKVTVKSTANAVLKNTVGKDNYYDPATKTFHLAYDWGVAPNTRIVEQTLTYVGPR